MSNRFYNYLSGKIVDYFRLNTPKAGDKFYIQFETEQQVERLYQEMSDSKASIPFSYVDDKRGQKYKTYQLQFSDVSLIVAASLKSGPHPDFMATLRNMVGLEKGYENSAILFIHCSSLDSILGGAGSLGKAGMPLNINEIAKDIDREINETGFSNTDKAILKLYLDDISKEMESGAISIFEYEDIINILGCSQITVDEYSTFELFPDDQLDSLSEKRLCARLRENHQNYVRVSEIHKYGLDEAKLEKYYGETGAKRLKNPEDWNKVLYSDIEKFVSDAKIKTSIEYFPIISQVNVWDREEGITKAKSRIRNILIFYNGEEEEYTLPLEFSEFTKNININISRGYETFLECRSSGKKLQVTLKKVVEPASFYHFKYSDLGAHFEFKIAVLRCEKELFEDVKTKYVIATSKRPEESSIRINTDEDEMIINPNCEKIRTVSITAPEQIVCVSMNERVEVSISEEYPEVADDDYIRFVISSDLFHVMISKAYISEKPTVIEGMKVWYMKHTRKMDFEIAGENKLIFGTQSYCARDDYRNTLFMEKQYIRRGKPCLVEKREDVYEPIDISLPETIAKCFAAIIKYYQQNDGIPSLTHLHPDLRKLYEDYINAITDEIGRVQEGGYLSETQKGIFTLGIIKRVYGDNEIFLTPLHPINIAYQLFVDDMDISGLDGKSDLIRKFQHTNLLPYINIDPVTKEKKVYIPAEQTHSPEWKIYIDETLPRYKTSKDFVSKLVPEKIGEFVEHFSYLFAENTDAPIRINLINTGDCREIVQGIIKYYAKKLNASEKVLPIRVTVYSAVKMDNAFEMMSKIDDVEELVHTLGLKVRVDEMSMEEVIDLYRKKVHFYFKDLEELDYAHITFMELDDKNQVTNTQMKDIPSGIAMNGLVSGVPSVLLGDTYRTGFGTKYVADDISLIDLAVKYNALNAAMNGDTYRRGGCSAVKMNPNKEHMLMKVYKASNWVTFIDPKVDLNYFKTDSDANDLLIIHYSDQYNQTTSGYDAITVTLKSEQYQEAISRYLRRNGVVESKKNARKIINIFNALNGDWLLRMLSDKSHPGSYFPIEKLSILSAMKLAVKRYTVEGVIWIPISLEEILRVSKSVGLPQNESIFSAKNLGFSGGACDDLLLIGIKNAEKVQVTFYPIEVKIGHVESGYLQKGVAQTLETKRIFDRILEIGFCKDKCIKTRLYRNFFVQQMIVNASKMLLYDVGDGKQGWEAVTASDLRRALLAEEYEIVESLIPEMKKGGVISFKDDCIRDKEYYYKDVLIIEKSKMEGVNLLVKGFDEIETVKWSLVTEISSIKEVESEDDNATELESNEYHSQADISVEPEFKGMTRLLAGESKDNIETENKKDIRVLIGKDKYFHDIYWEFGSKGLANRHLLITGTSGQGKTYSIQIMLYELAKSNISSVIFDYTEGFMIQQLEQPFKDALGDKIRQEIVYRTGVPINPFKRHEIELAGVKILEKESDVAARLADIFEHVYDFGAQQNSAVFEAVFNGLRAYGEQMNMRYFQQELEKVSANNKAAKSVISKMTPFFHTVEFTENPDFDWGKILYADEAKVNIMQLTMFSREMQVIITEMMLWDAWYYTKKYGSKEKPFVVVLDEAQNLSHTIKSPSAMILTEGRKFGWSAWFATQSLKVLKDDEVVRLLQAAVKLYFKPTDEEMIKIAKQIDITGNGNWLSKIQNLKKGQCIFAGDRMKANEKIGPSSPVITNVTAFEERN